MSAIGMLCQLSGALMVTPAAEGLLAPQRVSNYAIE